MEWDISTEGKVSIFLMIPNASSSHPGTSFQETIYKGGLWDLTFIYTDIRSSYL